MFSSSPSRVRRKAVAFACVLFALLLFPQVAVSADAESSWLETMSFGGDDVATPIKALLLLTVFGVAPAALLLTTCFPRVLVVLSFLRRAMGANELPSNLIVAGLSLAITAAVMMPIWTQIHAEAYVPWAESKEIDATEALSRAEVPVKKFMMTHVWKHDRESLRLFYRLSRSGQEASAAPQSMKELDFFVVLPAFVLTELKVAFQIGFLLFLPFVLIDLVVSSVLVSLGMFMLPPQLVSLPIKVLVFVLVDGWSLVVGQLLAGLQGS